MKGQERKETSPSISEKVLAEIALAVEGLATGKPSRRHVLVLSLVGLGAIGSGVGGCTLLRKLLQPPSLEEEIEGVLKERGVVLYPGESGGTKNLCFWLNADLILAIFPKNLEKLYQTANFPLEKNARLIILIHEAGKMKPEEKKTFFIPPGWEEEAIVFPFQYQVDPQSSPSQQKENLTAALNQGLLEILRGVAEFGPGYLKQPFHWEATLLWREEIKEKLQSGEIPLIFKVLAVE